MGDSVKDMSLRVENGDIGIIEGWECIECYVNDSMKCPPGEVLLHPEWGVGLEEFVGQALNEGMISELKKRVKATLIIGGFKDVGVTVEQSDKQVAVRVVAVVKNVYFENVYPMG
ncbi:MAG: hypothetical protein QI197_07380 [Candidatus Korarchaeota archaeon]|nr:hypothetical protein [Candidatus Korarchaeota archaeon]